MKKSILSVALAVIGLSLACREALACGGDCQGRATPAPAPRPAPTPPAAPKPPSTVNPNARPNSPEEADLELLLEKQRKQAGQGKLPIKRLPAQTKDNVPATMPGRPAGATTAAPSAPVVRGQSQNDRIVKAVATQQALAAQNLLLDTKRAEIERWDRPAQDKFLRAFGTTDDAERNRVLQRIDALIERNVQAMSTIADNTNFESFMESRKRQ